MLKLCLHQATNQKDFLLTAAKTLEDLAAKAIEQKQEFNLALSGGQTPLPLFELLKQRKSKLDWTKTQVFWADERMVPANHPDNNAHAAKSLLEEVSAKAIYPMPTHLQGTEAAKAYAKLLPTQLDCILLGLGVDGHIASLFPQRPSLQTKDLVVYDAPPNLVPRLSLSLKTINAAQDCLFLVQAPVMPETASPAQLLASKQNILRQALDFLAPPSLPVHLVRPKGSLIYIINRESDRESDKESALKSSQEAGLKSSRRAGR